MAVYKIESKKKLKESLWDSARVYDLYSYYFNRYGYIDDDKCKSLIKKQMEKEGSILPHTDEEFDKAFRAAQEREEEIIDMYDESLKESYGVYETGLNIDNKFFKSLVSTHPTKSEASKEAARLRGRRDKEQKERYHITYRVEPIKEESLKESRTDPREYDLQDLGFSAEEEEKALNEAYDALSKSMRDLGCDPSIVSQYSRWSRVVEDIAYLVAAYRQSYEEPYKGLDKF